MNKMTMLEKLYNEWRIAANEFEAEEREDAWDCGLQVVRNNFSEFIGCEITFEEMHKLEKKWNLYNL